MERALYSKDCENKICKTYFCEIKINLNSFFLARMSQAIAIILSVIVSRNPKLYHRETLPHCHEEDKEMLIEEFESLRNGKHVVCVCSSASSHLGRDD